MTEHPAVLYFVTANPGALHQAMTAAVKVARKADNDRKALRYVNLSTIRDRLVVQASDAYVVYRAELSGALSFDQTAAPRGFLLPAKDVAKTILPSATPAQARRSAHGSISINADHDVATAFGAAATVLTVDDVVAPNTFPSLDSLAARVAACKDEPMASYALSPTALALLASLAPKDARFTLRARTRSSTSRFLTTGERLHEEGETGAWSYTVSTLIRP